MYRKTPFRSQRGVTLIEVLIVVAILSLIASGIAISAYKHYEDVKKTHTRTTVKSLRHAVQSFRALGPTTTCPSFDELLEAAAIDEDSPPLDPWGSPWDIQCSDARVIVRSPGPDSTSQTEDDIVLPAQAADTR